MQDEDGQTELHEVLEERDPWEEGEWFRVLRAEEASMLFGRHYAYCGEGAYQFPACSLCGHNDARCHCWEDDA